MYTSVKYIVIDENNLEQRVDNFLMTALKGLPKSRIYRLLRKGEVRVNKKRIRPDYKLQLGDNVRIPPVNLAERADKSQAGTRVQNLLEQRILFEDEGILIINKPAAMPVHGGTGVDWGVIEALRSSRPEHSFLELAHRLDRGTSGCLLMAKKRAVLKEVHELLRLGKIQKNYLTLVHGNWPSCLHQVDLPLKKNIRQSGERMVKVNQEGKAALTKFEIVTNYSEHTLIKAKPITGRTHQIRVHCSAKGFPIVGDDKYGHAELDKAFANKRLFLHAHELIFTLPSSGQLIKVEAKLDDDLMKILDACIKS